MRTTSEEAIKVLFNKAQSVLIISHCRPDGDTIGASLALREALKQKISEVDVVCDGVIPQKYDFLAETENYENFASVNKKYDLYVFVDCASLGQTGDCCQFVRSDYLTLNIDHHVSNAEYAKYNYVDKKASCCEVMFALLKKLGYTINGKIAEFLLLGVVTDTGNFSHNNTTAQTLKVAGELMEIGADLYKINQKMFKSQPKNRSDLFLSVMQKMKFYHDGQVAMIVIPKSEMEKYSADASLTEGFIDYPMEIAGVEIGISVMENKEKTYKISFRSKGKADVNKLAAVFGGGGHVCASGAMLRGYLEDVIDKLVYTSGLYLED